MVDRSELLNLAQLRTRGWTPAMVRRLLGKEDAQWRNPFYRRSAPQRLFERERVVAAEGTALFEAARAMSAVRAERSRAIAERKKAALLEEIANLQIDVKTLDERIVRKKAMNHYHARRLHRWEYEACKPEGQTLDRLTVNFIRHELTHYDRHLAELFGGKVGIGGGDRRVDLLPDGKNGGLLADPAECERQLDARHPGRAASLLQQALATACACALSSTDTLDTLGIK